MLAVNLKGSFYTSQLVANAMREQKSGHILNFPGILGRHPMAMASAYCAAKFGVVGFTKCMADELKRFGVRFTLFYFGGIDSPFWDPISLKVQRDKMLSPATAAEAIRFVLTLPANAVPNEVVLQPESHQFL
jgi:NAD(P)-dependent dehydrogenase (short-subunit alcohol dehydrogenase family)